MHGYNPNSPSESLTTIAVGRPEQDSHAATRVVPHMGVDSVHGIAKEGVILLKEEKEKMKRDLMIFKCTVLCFMALHWHMHLVVY